MEAVIVQYPNDKTINIEQPIKNQEVKEKYVDYSKRALWLRAVVLGGHEGLVTNTLLLMIGMGTTGVHDMKAMILTSFIGLIAGAMSTAVAEFVSVYTQVDIMTYQVQRNIRMGRGGQKGLVPSPSQVAVSASLSYLVGGTMPLLAAGFIRQDHQLRFFVAASVACLSMFVLGIFGAALGKAPVGRSCARVMIGGWITIGIMLGKSQLLGVLGL